MDFTDNTNWKFPDGKDNKKTDAGDFTDGTYTVTVAAPAAYYWLSNNKALLMGKKGAILTLPKFDFEVERIDVVGSDGASKSTTRNIYVGDKSVSTQTTSAKGTKEYKIAADYQAVNTVYTIKVTNGYNDQIQKVLIWKKGTVTSNINGITIDNADANAPVYNLAGQKVSTSYKGVVIKAGKKFVQK